MDREKTDALREYYDTTDVSDQFENAEPDLRPTDEVMVSTSIRLPKSLVDKVREQAAALGVPATALMRQWVWERAQSGQEAGVVSVAELQRFIAEHHRPLAS